MGEGSAGYRYWAFISYSSKDTSLACKLHRRLETYRIPRDLVGRPGRDQPVPRQIFPIFRDRDELPMSADLGASIEAALRASRYLIVVCSRHAAASRWVNEEVRYFKSLGREDRILAIIVDGEPNASDNPAAAHEECFPPALRYRGGPDGQLTDERTEPIAGDLRKKGGDGWRRAFLKAVAGITGLGFDAFARREARRYRQRRIAVGIAAALALAASIWAWDYSRLKVAYYANVADRWGVPEGVGPLDQRTRAGREYHFRFESKRYKVRQVLRLNSAGRLLGGDSIQEISYAEDGQIKLIDLRDHNRKLVMRREFSELRHTDEGKTRYIDFKTEREAASLPLPATAGLLGTRASVGIVNFEMDKQDPPRRSDITGHNVLYDAQGRPTKVMYLNAYHRGRANAEGTFGQRFYYDDEGSLPCRVENLGFDGSPLPSRRGILCVQRTFDPLGVPNVEAYFGVDDKPVLSGLGFHKCTWKHDKYGNVIEQAFFDENGSRVLSRALCHRITVKRDEHGNPIEQACFDTDGTPAELYPLGWHKLTLEYDEHGYPIEQAIFGVDDNLTSHTICPQITLKQDDRGNLIEEASFGADGMPMLYPLGVHKLTHELDERGNRTELRLYGTDGKLAVGSDGYAVARQKYDDQDRVVGVWLFDAKGAPTVFRPTGIHGYLARFDERGNEIERTFLGTDGKPKANEDGYATERLEYNNRGDIVGKRSFDTNGNPAIDKSSGTHGWMAKVDPNGNEIERTFLGTDEKPMAGKYDYAVVRKKYDDQGRVIDERYFNVNGSAVIEDDDRIHGYLASFDPKGNEISRSFIGEDGKPMTCSDGYATVRRKHTDRGQVGDERYFGVDGKPMIDRLYGAHGYLAKFDPRGNEIEQTLLSTDGKPMAGKHGYVTIRKKYDDHGRVTDERYFDANGSPTIDKSTGTHGYLAKWDNRGNEIERTFLGTDGKPTADAHDDPRPLLSLPVSYSGPTDRLTDVSWYTRVCHRPSEVR